LDFLVENKIVVEIKKGNRFSKRHIDQVIEYLKASNLKLAILINFGTQGVTFKRIVNFSAEIRK
jgi:GxxExxY protein